MGEFYVSRSLRRNSIFKHADFKSMGDLKSLNSKEIINSGECLFIPPDMEENNINMEFEKKLSYSGSGDLYVFCGKRGNNILSDCLFSY